MTIEQREGVLDQVNEKGILLSGQRLSYSKWFEGDRPTEDALGRTIRVIVDAGDKCTFLKKVLSVGDGVAGWKPPQNPKGGSFGGGGRRMSPEELELEREKGIRIARSVAIDRAITMVEQGISIEKIGPLAAAVEEYLLKGTLPPAPVAARQEAPTAPTPDDPSRPGSGSPASQGNTRAAPDDKAPKNEGAAEKPARTKKVSGLAVNALQKEAMRAGIVADWKDFHELFRSVLRKEVKTPYNLTVDDFAKVESYVRTKLGRSKVA